MPRKTTTPLWCLALICLCFTFTSSGWIQWHYHLLDFYPAHDADSLAMVVGYLLQALGIQAAAMLTRRHQPFASDQRAFLVAIAAHALLAIPAAVAPTATVTAACGLLMCVSCGLVAFFYLQALARLVPTHRRGTAFGGGYAASILATWLFSLVSGGATTDLVAMCLLSAAAAALVLSPHNQSERTRASVEQPEVKTLTSPLLLACATVLVMSMVKNVGFSFPSSDYVSGVSLEALRLFYATGLLVAGIVTDRSRTHGAMLCGVALITPFVLLLAAKEPLPATILWAVDYFFYGFFSVFRIVLLSDFASGQNRTDLAAHGLLFGRIGDALGTVVCMACVGHSLLLAIIAAGLFAASVVLMTRLPEFMHRSAQSTNKPDPVPVPQKTEAQVFEEFCANHDLSLRERDVLRQILSEHTNAEAAAELFVSESTVKYHVRNLLRKTGCTNRKEVLAAYAREGV